MASQILTHEQAQHAFASVAEGLCPFGHGRLRTDLAAGVGWCDPCTQVEGVEVGYRTYKGGWTLGVKPNREGKGA